MLLLRSLRPLAALAGLALLLGAGPALSTATADTPDGPSVGLAVAGDAPTARTRRQGPGGSNWSVTTAGSGRVAWVADGTAPLGAGAAELSTSHDPADRVTVSTTTDVRGVDLDDIHDLTYDVRTLEAPGAARPSLKVVANVLRNGIPRQAVLIWEPYLGAPTTYQGSGWRHFEPLASSVDGWHSSGTSCAPSYTESCTWDELVAQFDGGFADQVQIGLGTSNPGVRARVDAVRIVTASTDTTWDLEPYVPPTPDVVDAVDERSEARLDFDPGVPVLRVRMMGVYNTKVFAATLTDVDGDPIAGRRVSFVRVDPHGATQRLCAGITDATGVAACEPPRTGGQPALVEHKVQARFGGDPVGTAGGGFRAAFDAEQARVKYGNL